jgi:hypothetical protein
MVDQKITLTAKDSSGKTPADLARENDRTETSIFLALKSNDVHELIRAGGRAALPQTMNHVLPSRPV